MEIAFNKLEGITYNAQQFSELPPHERMEKGQNMACCACNDYAFYRRRTINGRDACFGSRHVDGCPMASIQTVKNPSQTFNALANQAPRIVVDFAYGTVQTDGQTHRQEMPNQLDDDGHSGGRVVQQHIVSHRRLSSILRDLISSPQFCNSNQILHVAGFGETTVSDFFVRFDNILNEHIGHYRGYWGRIPSIGKDSLGEFWLNTGYPIDPSIFVPNHLYNTLSTRFRLEDTPVMGMYVLVFGTFQIGRSGKPFIEVADLCNITMCNQ